MTDPAILFASLLNGITTGAVYALIALGLTLIYGVLHIINFAHGAALMVALYAVWWLKSRFGIDPYLALPIVVSGMFALGYALQRGIVNRAGHGKDENILLVTLGIAIVLENLALLVFKSDTRTIETAYTLSTVAIGPATISLAKLVAFAGALVASAVLLWIVTRTDLGRAIRAVAKEKQGAKLMGIDVEHVYAMCFGIGFACLGAAACFLLPAYYVNPQVGAGFVPVAFTIVVLGGMGSFAGALVGGLLIGVVESLCGLYLGESLGQIGIFAIFIAVLLFRPQQAAEAAVHPGYPVDAAGLLIVELEGEASQVEAEFERLLPLIHASSPYLVKEAQDAYERQQIWKGRKSAFSAVGRLSPDFIVQDGVVPRGRLGEALEEIHRLSQVHGIRVANVFHAGDGNLHPLILYDGKELGALHRAELLAAEILELCIRFGGSITGEHGIGIEKRSFLPKMYQPCDMESMFQIRREIDPKNIANPGKMLMDGEAPALTTSGMHPLEKAGVISRE